MFERELGREPELEREPERELGRGSMSSALAARKRHKREAMDAVALQLEITIDKPRGYRLTRPLLDEIVREWADDGEAPEGVSVRIIDWKRPPDWKAESPEDVGASQDEARERFRGLLRSGRFTVKLRSY